MIYTSCRLVLIRNRLQWAHMYLVSQRDSGHDCFFVENSPPVTTKLHHRMKIGRCCPQRPLDLSTNTHHAG